MKIQHPIIPALCFALLTAGSAHAEFPVTGGPYSEQVRTLAELSGLRHQITQFPEQIKSGLVRGRQGRSPVDRIWLAQLDAIVEEVFDPEKITGNIIAGFLDPEMPEFVDELLTWYASDAGKKITRDEIATGTPEGRKGFGEFLASLETNPPDEDRLALIRELEESIMATEHTVEMVMATFLGTREGILAAKTSPDPSPPPRPLEEDAVRNMEMQVRQRMVEQVPLTFLYAYRDLTDTELKEYIQIVDSEAGRWFHQHLFEGLTTSLRNLSREVSRRLVEAERQIRQQRGKTGTF